MTRDQQHNVVTTDPHRPRYHFTPRAGWMNDPNGLVYFRGEYHLLYQYLTPRNWGHAVSTDLVHWEELPIALEVDELGHIWSGSIVVDWHNTSGLFPEGAGLVALFTHWLDGAQSQSLAYSHDNGRTWTKYSGNPVIPNPGIHDFRDPKAFWHEPTQSWVLVLAAGDGAQFYTSSNLIEWRYASTFRLDLGIAGVVWECPELCTVPFDGSEETAWVLVLSTNSPAGSKMHAFIGEFDGTTFQSDRALPVDYGDDFYAAVSWSDVPTEDGRRLWIGWMNNWLYGERIPTQPWQGAMSIPRELRLERTGEGLKVIQRPIAELQSLRERVHRWNDVRLADERRPLPEASGTALEILATFAVGDAAEVGVEVRASGDQRTIIGYRTATQELFVDRRQAGMSSFHDNFARVQTAPLVARDGTVQLQIFVDQSSVEVFADGGRVVLTDLIFPDPASDGVALYARGGEAIVQSLEVYQLASFFVQE